MPGSGTHSAPPSVWLSLRAYLPSTLAALCLAAFFAFLAARFSLRFFPTFFCSVVCRCFSPIPEAYALERVTAELWVSWPARDQPQGPSKYQVAALARRVLS